MEESVEVHQELNPVLWENEFLKDDVLNKLNNMAKEFLDYIEIPLNVVDIEIVGSNASYNYNEQSDIDLHIIVNSEFSYIEPSILRQLYNSKKNSFNDNYELEIDGIPVELYIEDVTDGNATNGRYSITNNNWVLKPHPIKYDIPNIDEALNEITQKCNNALTSNNLQDTLDVVNEIYMMRKLSLAQDGEAGVGNLVFKELRNNEMISKLKDHYYSMRSTELNNNELLENKIEEASLSRLYQHTKDKDTFAVIGSQDQDTKQSRFGELKNLVAKLRDKVSNIGFNRLEGTYTYEDGEQGIEDSLIVYNIPKQDALNIANTINQESIIWKDDSYFGFLDKNGNEEGKFKNDAKNMTFDEKITDMFGSKLRSGNTLKPAFAFECKLIENESSGSDFSKHQKVNIIKYPVCSIKLDNK